MGNKDDLGPERKPKRPRLDLNQLAHRIAQKVTQEKSDDGEKKPAESEPQE